MTRLPGPTDIFGMNYSPMSLLANFGRSSARRVAARFQNQIRTYKRLRMNANPLANPKERQRVLADWLHQRFEFTHFVSLATNTNDVSIPRMRRMFKLWDARLNRRLYGPKWLAHYDELLFWFAFIEKPVINPHWHLLVRLEDAGKAASLIEHAEPIWKKLISSGTANVQAIREKPERVADYVAKELGRELQYNEFIAPDQFRRF